MPTQYDMSEGDDLYRAVLDYDVQPMRDEPNPHYNPNVFGAHQDPNYRKNQVWRPTIQVPDGPEITKQRMIGPYKDVKPIKAYVTRNRGRHNSKNLRINRIERATAWEEVKDF